jgi:hypothetical protein
MRPQYVDSTVALLRIALILTLALTIVPALEAQDSVIVINPDAPAVTPTASRTLQPGVLDETVRRFNDSTTLRFIGDIAVPVGAVVLSPVGLFRGTLRIGGTVEGSITVVNGDVVILPGGTVSGDILVVGGDLVVRPGGLHRGSDRVYAEIAEVYRDNEGLLRVSEERTPLAELAAEKTFQVGDVKTTLKLSLGGTYNRVEGLPIYFGTIFQWRPSDLDTLSLEIRGILRTAPDQLDLRSDLGYYADLGWRSGSGPQWSVDLVARSEMVGIEQQPLSRSENGWSAFILQRDYRDWYQAEGMGATLGLSLARPLRIRLALHGQDERSVRASDPWSLLRNSDRWRPNPLIDDGRYFSGTIGLVLDTRNSASFPSSGWLVRASYDQNWSDKVAPLLLPISIRRPIPTSQTYNFGRVSFDARRYMRISPAVRVGARLFAEGWVGGDDLPMQRRYSLGGTDLMPGYRFRQVTCAPPGSESQAQAAFCNRMIALQVEVRTRLSFGWAYRLRDRERAELDRLVAIDQADLVFLADAGTAWIAGDGPGQIAADRLPAGSQWKYDVGVGLDLGGVGVYLAKALTDDVPVRLTLRLQRRF